MRLKIRNSSSNRIEFSLQTDCGTGCPRTVIRRTSPQATTEDGICPVTAWTNTSVCVRKLSFSKSPLLLVVCLWPVSGISPRIFRTASFYACCASVWGFPPLVMESSLRLLLPGSLVLTSAIATAWPLSVASPAYAAMFVTMCFHLCDVSNKPNIANLSVAQSALNCSVLVSLGVA